MGIGSIPLNAQELHDLEADAAVWHSTVRARNLLDPGIVDRELALRVARLELDIGFPLRALQVLEQHAGPDPLWTGAIWEVQGEAEFLLQRYSSAAQSFLKAAASSEGERAGILDVRIGRSMELSARESEASEYYANAAQRLSGLHSWLAVLEARTVRD
ncbi:MAG: hypothetical protein QNJ97_28525, partial [Myxococcota bacterium]|nr:hypothetical protein [Myxococcota bacterium]